MTKTIGEKILGILTLVKRAGNPSQQPKHDLGRYRIETGAKYVFPLKRPEEEHDEGYESWSIETRADPGIGPTEALAKRNCRKF